MRHAAELNIGARQTFCANRLKKIKEPTLLHGLSGKPPRQDLPLTEALRRCV